MSASNSFSLIVNLSNSSFSAGLTHTSPFRQSVSDPHLEVDVKIGMGSKHPIWLGVVLATKHESGLILDSSGKQHSFPEESRDYRQDVFPSLREIKRT